MTAFVECVDSSHDFINKPRRWVSQPSSNDSSLRRLLSLAASESLFNSTNKLTGRLRNSKLWSYQRMKLKKHGLLGELKQRTRFRKIPRRCSLTCQSRH